MMTTIAGDNRVPLQRTTQRPRVNDSHAYCLGASDLETEYLELLQLLTETGRQPATTAIANH